MVRWTYIFGLGLGALMLAGCQGGLSPRDAAGQGLQMETYALYDLPMADKAVPAPVKFPISVAVAQTGEIAPPQSFVKTLDGHPELFGRVNSVPAVIAASSADFHYHRGVTPQAEAQDANREQMRRMLQMARDMGDNYLMLVGGTLDSTTNTTALSGFDLTIVGAFIVPSRDIKTEATASAALIDVNSGRVVQFSGAQSKKWAMRSAAETEEGQISLAQQTRDAVLAQLADQVVKDCDARVAQPVH